MLLCNDSLRDIEAFVEAKDYAVVNVNHEPNINGADEDTRKGAVEIRVRIEFAKAPSCTSHPGDAPRTGMSRST